MVLILSSRADRKSIQAHEWKLIIVDEGHRIKNVRCKLITELKLYRSTHRYDSLMKLS